MESVIPFEPNGSRDSLLSPTDSQEAVDYRDFGYTLVSWERPSLSQVWTVEFCRRGRRECHLARQRVPNNLGKRSVDCIPPLRHEEVA